MNPFESMQTLTKLWGRDGGNSSTFEENLKKLAPLWGMNSATGGDNADATPDLFGFGEAQRAFEQSWSKALDVSSSFTMGLQGTSGTDRSDTITAEILAKIFDPRGWLPATSEMDEALQRMAEGPRLADLWQVERKFAAVFGAWVRLRRHSLEHNRVIIEAWTKAVGVFAKLLNEKAARGDAPLKSVRELLTLWGETANDVLLETQRSEVFLQTQREVLKASTDLRLTQRAIAEFYSEMFGYPTRAELDDVHKSVTELRRELRALQRASRGPKTPPQVNGRSAEPKEQRRAVSKGRRAANSAQRKEATL